MDTVPLYNLGPTAQILLTGLLLAGLPLGWVAYRQKRQGGHAGLENLTLVIAFLTFDLILFGAFTRLTDSGLGCPDWPGCYGNASPLGAHAAIAAAQSAMPTGPVTHGKAWIEMVHRYLATGVGALIVVLTVASWRAFRRQRGSAAVHPVWATLTLFWVCVQGAFGALTVTMKLFPAIVTLHLLGGLVLLMLLTGQAAAGRCAAKPLSAGLRRAAWLVLACVLVQVSLGGWVSTNYAVLACNTFPSCQGSWWPAMDFRAGFELWRPLGQSASGELLSFQALTAIHYVHRLAAYVVLVLLAFLALRLQAVRPFEARWLWGLTAWQLMTGLSNVVLGWPLVAAVAHTGGAAGLLAVLTWTLFSSSPTRTACAAAPHNAAGSPA